MKHPFIDTDNYFFLKISILLSAASTFLYVVHDPVGPPSGNSWLGYSLGTIAGLIILWLLWFGVRKRTYIGTRFSLVRWLSGHVWLGLTLLVLATLHCGFQFDPNIHTLFYVLMVLTILSGMVGVYFYIKIPRIISNNLRGSSSTELQEDLNLKAREALSVAREIDPDVLELMVHAIDHLFLAPKSSNRKALARLEEVGASLLERRGSSPSAAARLSDFKTSLKTQYDLQGLSLNALVIDLGFDRSPGEKLQSLLDLINDMVACQARIEKDRQANLKMRIWLLFHVPLSLATVVGLFVHIISVFYY